MAKTPFLLVVVDDDRRIFNVVGPVTHEAPWTKHVIDCQQTGRKVRLFSSRRTKEQIAADYATQMGYEYVKDSVLDLSNDEQRMKE